LEENLSQWISGDITSHGTKLHYYRTGGEKPPLVLLHGITDDGLCWGPVAEVLSVQYDVIMVDVRGHGKSDAPETGYTYATMATELAGLITGLGLEKPAVLGHSMGADLTLTFTGLFPELPRAILLEDPPPFWNWEVSHKPQDDFLEWIIGNKRKTRDELLREAWDSGPHWPDAELQPWVDAKHRFSLKITDLVSVQDAIPRNFLNLLKQITCPALFICADLGRGAASSEEDIAKLKESIPQLRVIHIPNAGHNIRRDQFSRYMDVIQSFLVTGQSEGVGGS
jgi:pimeloyl-ACP methyl ester carboxylesterase